VHNRGWLSKHSVHWCPLWSKGMAATISILHDACTGCAVIAQSLSVPAGRGKGSKQCRVHGGLNICGPVLCGVLLCNAALRHGWNVLECASCVVVVMCVCVLCCAVLCCSPVTTAGPYPHLQSL
jgi:hypothetical protein